MENRWQIALSAGVLGTIWGGVADLFHLINWIGFLGCTTYFAQSKTGFQGVLLTWYSNLSGVFWAWLMIFVSRYFEITLMGYIATGIITTLMCLQACRYKFSFLPGTFVGCCTVFAIDGDISMTLPALMIGALLGYLMKQFTTQLIFLTPKWQRFLKRG